ncbi:hypothetical protein QSH94_24780, partial [Escherichia coli]|nr:hypothetical protein [Escherichia coli]
RKAEYGVLSLPTMIGEDPYQYSVCRRLAMVFPYPSSDYVEEIISLDKCIITRLEEVIHDDLGKPAAKVSLTMN